MQVVKRMSKLCSREKGPIKRGTGYKTQAATKNNWMRKKCTTLTLYLEASKRVTLVHVHFYGNYRVAQGGKDQGSEKSMGNHCLQILHSFLSLREGGRQTGKPGDWKMRISHWPSKVSTSMTWADLWAAQQLSMRVTSVIWCVRYPSSPRVTCCQSPLLSHLQVPPT